MKLITRPLLAALCLPIASCGSPRPQPIPIYPAQVLCPALTLPRALTDPVETPSFLREPTR